MRWKPSWAESAWATPRQRTPRWPSCAPRRASWSWAAPGNEAYDRLRNAAAQIRKSLITLHEAPTGNPYVAYFNKGIVANPAVVVAELVSTGGGARIELTAFTAKVGLVQGHSCNAAIDKLAKLL